MSWNHALSLGKQGTDASWISDTRVIVKKIPLSKQTTAAETQVWTLPTNIAVVDVIVNVTTAEATGTTKTIDIGTDGSGSNDPDGFAASLSVAALGWKRPEAAVTVGGTETYYSANTRGALLTRGFKVGGNAATNTGIYSEKLDFTSGGEKLTWTAGSAQTEFAGELYVFYIVL
jgi:hypothetical protein